MKECTIIRVGVAKNGKNFLLVQYFEGDFEVSGCVFLKEGADMKQYGEGAVIKVPTAALPR